MLSIYKKEISGYFNSLVGYLVIGFFLLLSGLICWVFPNTSILTSGYASMQVFFEFAPYLFLFLIPAITMRSFSGERADGMLDWLYSKPISLTQLLIGKFLGGFTIVCLALLPTWTYVFAIYQLAAPVGNIDLGHIIGSYLGLLLVSASFVAIGIFASAMTKFPVVAFLLGAALCFFMFFGFEAMQLERIGMQAHYEALGRGVLDSRDVLYFLGIIVFFLFLTLSITSLNKSLRVGELLFRLLAVLLMIVAINYAGTLFFGRIDFTTEKRFSLSDLTKHTLDSLQQPLEVTLLLEGNLPAGFQRLKSSAVDLIHDYQAYANRPIAFSTSNPLSTTDPRAREKLINELRDLGVQPIQLNVDQGEGNSSQQLLFPYALISDGQQEMVVNLLQNQLNENPEMVLNHAIENLEYAFTSVLRKLHKGEKPIVGFTEGHGELSDLQLKDAMFSLAQHYQVGRIELEQIDLKGLKDLDVLIIAKPTEAFSETEKFKIDYFLMNGGRLVFAIDQLDGDLERMRDSQDSRQVLSNRTLNLDDLFFTYGLRFNYNVIVDLNCNFIPMKAQQSGFNTQLELVPWPLHPIIMPQTTHPLINKMQGLQLEYVGTLDTISVQGISSQVILHSSPYVRSVVAPFVLDFSLISNSPSPESIQTAPLPVAAVLTGNFPSLFYNRPIPQGIADAKPALERGAYSKIFAIADGDLFKNQVNQSDNSAYPLGWNRFTNKQYGNKVLLFNLMDYFLDDESLIQLRNKTVTLRMLDRLKVQDQKKNWQVIHVALPILIVLIAGVLQQYLRRRRFALPHTSRFPKS